MNEISKILEAKEKVIYEGKPKYFPYMIANTSFMVFVIAIIGFFAGFLLKSYVLPVIIGLTLLLLGILYSQIAYLRTHYAVTNKRIILQTGGIGRDFKSIDYDRIQNISVSVGLLGVIFGAGNVKIFTGEMISSGHSVRSRYDIFYYVAQPYEILKEIQTHISARKEKFK